MDYVSIKLYAETRRLLRKIAAETGEQMVQVMDRLCREEWLKISTNQMIAHDIAHSDPLRSAEDADKPQ